MPNAHRLAATIALAIAAIANLPDARAALVTRLETYPAVTACQPALPVFDGNVRKRPRALVNEGTSTAFITCGLNGRGSTAINFSVRKATVEFTTLNDSVSLVTCTALDLAQDAIVSRSAAVDPTAGVNFTTFVALDFGAADRWYTPAFSCALPPGTGITQLGFTFVEDNGV